MFAQMHVRACLPLATPPLLLALRPANNQNGRWNRYKCWRHKTLPMDTMRRRHQHRCCCRCCCCLLSHKKNANLAHEASTTTTATTTKKEERKQQSCGKSIKYINLPRNVHGKRIKKLCCPAWWRVAAQWKI